MRAALTVAALLLAACAQDYAAPPPVTGPAEAPGYDDDAPLQFFTAGPGDVMVYSDACMVGACAPGAADEWGRLVYVGMRAADQAVFEFRRDDGAPGVALTATAAAHLFVPTRPDTPVGQADFVAARAGDARPDPSVTEIVLDPVAGVEFGAETVAITIASATPARVVYTVAPAL